MLFLKKNRNIQMSLMASFMLIFCNNSLLCEEIYSTSSNFNKYYYDIKNKSLKKNLGRNADNSSIITFSEFSVDTSIANQYEDQGIIFGGDNPFISTDSSNPTSPVLSGSPRFNGAITGKFIDPETHEPSTVDHFELDAGYFDNLSSTRLQWFNSENELLGEKYDEEYGIEHFVVDASGIASWRIEIINQEDAGFAIDNISFVIKESPFNYKFNIDRITHTPGSNISNTFSLYFKDLESKDASDIKDICNDYNFLIIDSSQELSQVSCNVNKQQKALKLNFTIDDSPYNIVNAKVYIEDKQSGEREEIKDIKDFYVYGTNFNAIKDGFSFYNGEWNRYMLIQNKEITLGSYFCWKFDMCSDSQIYYSGVMLKIVEAFKHFLSDSYKDKAVDLIGYYKIKDYTEYNPIKEFGGVCHGLAVSAIANFNNKSEANAWGTDLIPSKTKDQIISIFKNHWDNRNDNNESAKPFSKNVYDYDINEYEDALHSLAKIGFYFISQPSYEGTYWVGKSSRIELNTISGMNNFHQQHLQNNKVSIFGFDLKKNGKREGGHTIIATELIKYNDNSIVVVHDNNYIGELPMLSFNNSFELSSFVVETTTNDTYNNYGDLFIQKRYSSYDKYYGFDTFTDGQLAVYGKNNIKKATQKKSIQKREIVNESYDYKYTHHISIKIVGGKIEKVTETQTQSDVILNTIIDEMNETKAYMKNNMLITEFFLPKNKKYKIEFKKYKQYPAFEVYVKIPDESGKVNIINYDNISSSQNDETLAYFYVGNDNVDKTIKRSGDSDVPPVYDESLYISIIPATHLKAVTSFDDAKIMLSWSLPDNANLKEIVLLRKNNSQPADINDGSIIFRGISENYIDNSISSNEKYYYAIYSVDKNGNISDANTVYVDTHKASIFGYVNDTDGNPVSDVEVILKNGVGIIKNELNSELTDKNGFYSFNNLPLGTYLLQFSRENYSFHNSDMTVELQNKTLEVSNEAIGVPVLTLNVNDVIKYGEIVNVSWNGQHIGDDEKINIKLFRNNTWESIASDLEYSLYVFNWSVTKPDDLEATIKIELASNINTKNEKQIYIAPVNVESTNEDQSDSEDDSSSLCFVDSILNKNVIFYNIIIVYFIIGLFVYNWGRVRRVNLPMSMAP